MIKNTHTHHSERRVGLSSFTIVFIILHIIPTLVHWSLVWIMSSLLTCNWTVVTLPLNSIQAVIGQNNNNNDNNNKHTILLMWSEIFKSAKGQDFKSWKNSSLVFWFVHLFILLFLHFFFTYSSLCVCLFVCFENIEVHVTSFNFR